MEALTEATAEVATTALGFETTVLGPQVANVSAPRGAYLSLLASTEPLQIAFFAEAAGCQVLAKALLGMDPAEDDLPDGDVSDAMCELVNMLAGGVKRRMADPSSVSVGLPMFVAGHPLPNQHQEINARQVEIGSVPASLMLVTAKADGGVKDSSSGLHAHPLSSRTGKVRSA